jgi:phage protein U
MSTMMGLGNYRFSLNTSTYQQFRRSIEYRWQSQERLQNNPAMQYLGHGMEQIDLEGTIYPEFRGGLDQIEDMKGAADKGESLLLIDGMGGIWGRWVITRLEENRERSIPHTRGRRVGLDMLETLPHPKRCRGSSLGSQ